jgi:hypothetical protein
MSAGRYTSKAVRATACVQAPADDFDGLARRRDGNGDGTPAVDIGAFEVQ